MKRRSARKQRCDVIASLLCYTSWLGVVACSSSEIDEPPARSGSDAPVLEPDRSSNPPGAPVLGDLGGGDDIATPAPSGGAGGCRTTLSGITRDPAGSLPLYNVVVYVPSEPLAPIARGASCETCDGNFSGRPIAATVSDAAGAFTLDIS